MRTISVGSSIGTSFSGLPVKFHRKCVSFSICSVSAGSEPPLGQSHGKLDISIAFGRSGPPAENEGGPKSLHSKQNDILDSKNSPVELVTSKVNSGLHQRSEEWYALRRDRLTASMFGDVLGLWKGRRLHVWKDKIGILGKGFEGNEATRWGESLEGAAIHRYKRITGNQVNLLGFKIYKEEDVLQSWIGGSPDGLIDGNGTRSSEIGGILEVKCPHNKGMPFLGTPWHNVPSYYLPQAQGLMEILDREWMDFYVWTMNGSSIFRIKRDRKYWALIYAVLSDFWWGNVVPAKMALEEGQPFDQVQIKYAPGPDHLLTPIIKKKSTELALTYPLILTDSRGVVKRHCIPDS